MTDVMRVDSEDLKLVVKDDGGPIVHINARGWLDRESEALREKTVAHAADEVFSSCSKCGAVPVLLLTARGTLCSNRLKPRPYTNATTTHILTVA